MTDKELETTGLFGIIRNQEDLDIGEQLEELEDRLDYLDIDDRKKEDIEERIVRIREEDNEEIKEALFNEFIDELDS